MTEHEKLFFNILRSALWGTPVKAPDGFSQWGAIMRLANNQALMGLVGDVLLTRPEIRETLSPKFVEKLQDIPLNSMGMHTQTNNTLQLLVQTLRMHGIEPVLLKGQGLSVYYPTPQLRQCGDIDIYVGKENYEKTYDVLLPIVTHIEDRAKIWNTMHFEASIGSVMVEVHHKADEIYSRRGARLYKDIMEAGLSKDLCPQRFGEIDVMTPNDTYNAFYVFGHLWRHFSSSGVGLRQFCDWACFLHTHVGKLNLPYLKKMLEDLDFMKPWQVLGCFLVKELGLPADEFPFYNERYDGEVDRVREYVMTDGNFGVNLSASQEARRGYLHGKWVTVKYYILRFARMFSIFPKHTIMRFYYMLRDGLSHSFKEMFKKK